MIDMSTSVGADGRSRNLARLGVQIKEYEAESRKGWGGKPVLLANIWLEQRNCLMEVCSVVSRAEVCSVVSTAEVCSVVSRAEVCSVVSRAEVPNLCSAAVPGK